MTKIQFYRISAGSLQQLCAETRSRVATWHCQRGRTRIKRVGPISERRDCFTYKHDDNRFKETAMRCQRNCFDINHAEVKKEAKPSQELPNQGQNSLNNSYTSQNDPGSLKADN